MSRLKERLADIEKKADRANLIIKMKKIMDSYIVEAIEKILKEQYHIDLYDVDIDVKIIVSDIMANPFYENAVIKLEDAFGVIDTILQQWFKDAKKNYPKMFK